MKIIIPMSGIGSRFLKQGYSVPKPLIRVEEKPIIEHIVSRFDKKNDEFIFICNEYHLQHTEMKKVLSEICNKFKIISIPQHKLGPVYTVLQISNIINDYEPYIVNYCDFSWRWDYKDFLQKLKESKYDGCLIAYKGFHPHLLVQENLYASMRVDEKNHLKEIKEKFSFTENKMDSYQSSGTYYFASGLILKKYFSQLVEKNNTTNNEYYVSLVFEEMKKDNKSILVYEIPTFLQWGTPDDLKDYNYWSGYFNHGIKNNHTIKIKNLSALIPMAGRGERFIKAGYTIPKPLIKVDSEPMIVHSTNSLPESQTYHFICRNEDINHLQYLKCKFNSVNLIPVNDTTDGQAATCLLAKDYVDQNSPLVIGACDNGMTWDENKLEKLSNQFDALIFSYRNHPTATRNPEMCGWVKINDQDQAIKVSCKSAISTTPFNDHAIVGTFYFNKAKDYFIAAEKLIKQNRRINNEFYVDEVMNILIEDGLKVGVFEVDHYLGFGTPDDLKTYQYWKKFFHEQQY